MKNYFTLALTLILTLALMAGCRRSEPKDTTAATDERTERGESGDFQSDSIGHSNRRKGGHGYSERHNRSYSVQRKVFVESNRHDERSDFCY